MTRPERLPQDLPPAIRRLASLAPLDVEDLAALDAAVRSASLVKARREVVKEGRSIGAPRIIASGWAAQVRILAEGRRLFLSFFLPGDVIGWCQHSRPLAVATIVALTDVTVCAAPPVDTSPQLAEAYAVGQALREADLLAQVSRLGGMSAQERIGDLMLHLHERLGRAGLVRNDSFDVPLTQEGLADALGLTPVHVNRTLQLMRRNGDLDWKGGSVTLHDPAALARKFFHHRPSVSEGHG